MERSKAKNIPGNNGQNIWICALIGGGIGLALTFLTALIMPMAIINTGDPNSLATPMAAVCIGLGGMAGAVTAAKKSKDAKFLAGLLAAVIILLPMAVISFVVPTEFDIMNAIVMLAALGISASIGSFTVAKIDSSGKRSMKKAMKRR